MRVFRGLGLRLLLSYVSIILLTLALAGLSILVLIGGYRREVAASTLHELAAPFYFDLARAVQEGGTGLEPLQRAFDERAAESDVATLLVDQEGRAVLGSRGSGGLVGEIFELPEFPETQAVPGEPPVDLSEQAEMVHESSDGVRYLYVVAPLPGPRLEEFLGGPAYAVIALPEDSSRGAVGDLGGRLLRAGLIALVVSVVVALFISGSLLRPLHAVTRAAGDVSQGDYATQVPVRGPREARQLAQAFNRMTEAVGASRRTTREFLANISHELKTPLTSIRGFAQALLDGTIDDQAGRERAARLIEDESRRLLFLTEELLDLSRIESGQARMTIEPVDPAELLNGAAEIFSLRAAEAGLALEVSLPGEPLPAIRGDFERLEQVLGNLIDNALRHTDRGGVTLSGRRLGGDRVEVVVADSGPGIAEAELERIFERFQQGGGRTSGGSGLGLAISREIVLAHGGTIRAENRAGGGARFVIELPVAGPAANGRPAG